MIDKAALLRYLSTTADRHKELRDGPAYQRKLPGQVHNTYNAAYRGLLHDIGNGDFDMPVDDSERPAMADVRALENAVFERAPEHLRTFQGILKSHEKLLSKNEELSIEVDRLRKRIAEWDAKDTGKHEGPIGVRLTKEGVSEAVKRWNAAHPDFQGTVTGDGAYTPSDDHVRLMYVGYPLTMIQPGSWAEERLAEINRFLESKKPVETKTPAHDLLMSLKMHRGRDEPLAVFIARLGHEVNQRALEETGRG